MNGKAIIVIPAYNEEANIGRTIELVKATKANAEIVVVNDGSTDRTAAIARKMGCEVIDFKRNFGKANAFFAGVKAALRKNPEAVVTLDADMLDVPPGDLARLIEEARGATLKKEIKMTVGVIYERDRYGNFGPTVQSSGIRSFSIPACLAVIASSHRGKIIGYGLEGFLNDLFRRGRLDIKSKFIAGEPHRGKGKIAEKQHRDIRISLKRLPKHRRTF